MPAVRADSDAVPAPPSRYADDLTMELPIFRELESAWFNVTRSNPQVPVGSDQPVVVDTPAPVGAPTPAPVDAAAAAPAPAPGAAGRVRWRA